MIWVENEWFGVPWELLGRLWKTKWPLEVTTVAPLGYIWAALGATLGGQKATREAPRRVTGPFGGLNKGPLEGSWGHFGGGFGIEKMRF